MGHYSLLDIGRIHLEFKYRVPYVCTILFEPQELRVEVHKEEGFPYCEFAGYQTTAQAAIEKLQRHGYNEAFFSTVLAPHLEDFDDFYLDTLIGDAPIEVSMKEASEHARFLETLDMSPLIPAGSGDFTAYIEFLRVILDGRRRRVLERKLAKIGASPNVLQNALRGTSFERTSQTRESIELYLDDLWGHIFKLSWYLPTAVIRAASILCEICDDYGDFYDILVVWLLLKATAPKASVILDFGDLLEGPEYHEDAATFLNRVKEEAATKALAFQHAFSFLLAKDAELDVMHRRNEVSALLADLSKEEDPHRKGHLLEDICCQIFTLSSELSIESTRLNNKDEELDIALRNNITRSFFISLRSPIILVECKNWSSPVSASVLRDFESKVRNHSNLCRIGIFVALNGFASTDKEVLRRLGRDDVILVLVTGDDLRELAEGTDTLEDWLECLIARSLK
jgi:hypothetical protein